MKKGMVFLLISMALLAGCRDAVIRNYEEQPIVRYDGSKLSMEKVERAIVLAGRDLGWVMQSAGEGRMVGILELRDHKAVVDIEFDSSSYSIKYKDSSNLLYQPPNKIHRQYNHWVANLVKRINASIELVQ